MNPIRFRALLDAYGAAPDRWPKGEREAALALLRSDPQAAADYEREGAFDGLLALSRSPAPSAALADRILAGAPIRRLRKRVLPWWTGLALAGAGAAGVLCGTTAAAAFEPASALPSYAHGATAFGTVSEDSEES
jgi:ferric-dicitrate binding protein FerR (iron transport regulator)